MHLPSKLTIGLLLLGLSACGGSVTGSGTGQPSPGPSPSSQGCTSTPPDCGYQATPNGGSCSGSSSCVDGVWSACVYDSCGAPTPICTEPSPDCCGYAPICTTTSSPYWVCPNDIGCSIGFDAGVVDASFVDVAPECFGPAPLCIVACGGTAFSYCDGVGNWACPVNFCVDAGGPTGTGTGSGTSVIVGGTGTAGGSGTGAAGSGS